MQNTEQTLEEIESQIDWDNYKNEDGTYWNTPEDLYCKLEQLLDENEDLEEEFIETITQVQKIMTALSNDIKGEF